MQPFQVLLRCSLLLATCLFTFLLALAGHNLSKHHNTVAIHEGNAREALASLECISHKWLRGWNEHWAISFDFRACGSSIFLPPVSLPIFHLSAAIRQAERPHRTNPPC